jgi:hypothetical protein
MQIVQAAGEEYLNWPATLSDTSIEGFIQAALRAATFARRNTLADDL